MKSVFECAVIALCLSIFIWPAFSPREISGKDISGGHCCSSAMIGQSCGVPCISNCIVCNLKDANHVCYHTGEIRCNSDWCSLVHNCVSMGCDVSVLCP